MSAARWVVRSPDGDYAIGTLDRTSRQRFASKVDLNTARGMLDHFAGWRIVRLLSPAESRRKAAADALRELAAEIRAETSGPFGASNTIGYDGGWSDAKHQDAKKAEEKATALWPRKGAGR